MSNSAAYTTGACLFCGQAVALNEEHFDQAAANEAATAICKCPEATRKRELELEIIRAKDKIQQVFGERAAERGFRPVNSEAAIEFMELAAELIAKDEIDAVTIHRRGLYTAVITTNSKGKIKVSRRETRACSVE